MQLCLTKPNKLFYYEKKRVTQVGQYVKRVFKRKEGLHFLRRVTNIYIISYERLFGHHVGSKEGVAPRGQLQLPAFHGRIKTYIYRCQWCRLYTCFNQNNDKGPVAKVV